MMCALRMYAEVSRRGSAPFPPCSLLACRSNLLPEQVAAQLQQLASLREHVSPPYLGEVPEMAATLAGIEARLALASEAAAARRERSSALLERHATVTALLSEKAAQWDEVLAAVEARAESRLAATVAAASRRS